MKKTEVLNPLNTPPTTGPPLDFSVPPIFIQSLGINIWRSFLITCFHPLSQTMALSSDSCLRTQMTELRQRSGQSWEAESTRLGDKNSLLLTEGPNVCLAFQLCVSLFFTVRYSHSSSFPSTTSSLNLYNDIIRISREKQGHGTLKFGLHFSTGNFIRERWGSLAWAKFCGHICGRWNLWLQHIWA